MPRSSAVYTHLTDAKVAKLSNQTGGKDLFIRDRNVRGFGVRLSPNNVKSFFVEATCNGKFTRKALGQHPILAAAEARNRAVEALQLLKGIGVAAEANRASELHGIYFKDWHGRPVVDIRRREILDRYRYLCQAHGIGIASRCMRVLSAFIQPQPCCAP